MKSTNEDDEVFDETAGNNSDFTPFTDGDFSRLDESDDRRFYCRDRLEPHTDILACSTMEKIISQLILEPDPSIRLSFGERVIDEELERRTRAIKETLRCPHCLESLTKYTVPDHPFTQWDNEYMYVCFNNACPYYTRSWETMHSQGNVGMSYRLMYNPEKDRCMATPVPSPGDSRTSLRG